MARERKPSLETLKVLAFLMEEPQTSRYGLEIAQAASLSAGTLYPILFRLEQREWVESEWEDIDQHKEGRKRRRYYRLTPQGLKAARDLINTHARPLVVALDVQI